MMYGHPPSTTLREKVLKLLYQEKERTDAAIVTIPKNWKVSLPSTPRIHPAATDEMITAFTERTGIAVPPDLCDWWKTCNGARLADGLWGIDNGDPHRDVYVKYDTFNEWRDLKWIPIAGDGCGNHYVQAASEVFVKHNPILFVEPILDPKIPQYIVASGVWQFLFFILSYSAFSSAKIASRRTSVEHSESFWWPSDRDKVLSVDPDVANFNQFPFPWDL